MFDAFLFDLDGTLIDTETIWIDAIELALHQRGAMLSHAEATELVLGRSWPDIFANIRRRFPAAYASREEMETITVPSITLLRRLAGQAPTVIVSGSTRNRIAESLELMDAVGLVPFYIGAEDYERGKPAPDCFLLAAERLGLLPERCLVFEDSAAGVAAAKSAGMACVALHRQATEPPLGADLVLRDLDDFEFAKLPAK
jgi:HAD superfamily hydrolase (TIGR01549 family)